MFQDLRFDISFADALFLMPRFAPTIRDLLMNKEKLLELVKIPLNENCSAMLLKKLPEKLGDPGKFLIPCEFPGMEILASHFDSIIYFRITLEENDAFLYDKSISFGKCHEWIMIQKHLWCLNNSLNEGPISTPPMDLKLSEVTEAKSSIERPPEIPIDPHDQEKTTFTCPYGTFAYRRMPFGLCNAPGTFQRCHKISKSGIEVDRAKVDVIAKLPHPTTVKGVRSFLGHAGFYRRFIQDFSKISRPITHLLEKDTPFVFSQDCINAFETTLKKKLTEAPILVVPDWNLPFELMCDASDFAISAVLGQRKTKHFQPIHYASKTMTEAQIHYTTTEKEMLAVVYVYTDHSALKYLMNKQDAKPRLFRWVLLLQEFDIIILNKKGSENLAADHLSRLGNPHKDILENKDINEHFPLETLGVISTGNQIIRSCVSGHEALEILKACHEGPTGGHHSANLTAQKVFDASFFWPTIYRDSHTMIKSCLRVKDKAKFYNEMRCLKTLSKFVKSSMYGVSILWDHFRLHMGINTSSLSLIIF
ncbi:reverse transcriptase domain-containing protein [Tanacetum coccineum]